jgi:hypothetical protein
MATIQEIIMTRQRFTRKSSAGLFGLLLAGALTQAWASDTARSPIPGYDRVGKPVISATRGHLDEAGAEIRGQQTAEIDASAKALEKRKTELTKRMFWIMMSMR